MRFRFDVETPECPHTHARQGHGHERRANCGARSMHRPASNALALARASVCRGQPSRENLPPVTKREGRKFSRGSSAKDISELLLIAETILHWESMVVHSHPEIAEGCSWEDRRSANL